jgi:hypothetical protein
MATSGMPIKAIEIGDADLEGILLEPGNLPQVIGKVTEEGRPVSRAGLSHIGLQSLRNQVGAQNQADGTFRLSDLLPGSYRVAVSAAGSFFVQSIRQGGRDVRSDGIEIGELPPDPLEIDLSSHGATIAGVIAVSDSNPPGPVVVVLFRRVAEGVLFEKQAYVNGFAMAIDGRALSFIPTTSASGPRQFTVQGVAPGEYILFAWLQDAPVAFAEPEFMREYGALGKTVRVTADQRVSVVLDHLLPKMRR